MSKKKRTVVICPGRGSYTKDELGYLKEARPLAGDFLDDLDRRRHEQGDPTITELDSAPQFKVALHTKGEHASPLIYACSYYDFTRLDKSEHEIVAITGNSMGWYIALALGGSLGWAEAFALIQGMGGMMRDEIIGGQIIYPICDENWHIQKNIEDEVMALVDEVNGQEGFQAFLSIRLGGYLVIGGNNLGLKALLQKLPAKENYPFQLVNHAAFHTPLMKDTSELAFDLFAPSLFKAPLVPLIDGRGAIWKPHSSRTSELYQYTLGHQVVEPYDFTQAVTVALKEFAPDRLVLLGPGGSLGGAIGQILVSCRWQGLRSKSDFQSRQQGQPFLWSMGRPSLSKV